MKMPISILMADDHALVRQGLSGLLNADGRFKVVGEARNGREAVELARVLKPDVVVMDIAMPVLNGLDATRQIIDANPAAKIIILSAHTDDAYVQRASDAGAFGFIEKQASAVVFTEVINQVVEGRSCFSPTIARRQVVSRATAMRDRGGIVKRDGARLTFREIEILQLIAEGSANKQTASVLKISVKTVEKHRQNLMKKLGIHHTAGLTAYAIASGVIIGDVQLKMT